MRGLFIFSKINDIVFHKVDNTLKEHLITRGVKTGLIAEDESHQITNSCFRNLLVQTFSPMVTSQRIMSNQFDNNYKTIENEDNSYLVFEEKLGYTFLYIDHLESNSLLAGERQLNSYKEFTRLLCGPALHVLGCLQSEPDNSQSLLCPSEILGRFFDTWNDMYQNEISLLVEGVERLLINRELSCICIKLMENVLTKMRSSTTPYQEVFSHALILVDSKLLYLYSSRNAMELSKGDLLMIISLVKVLHLKNKDDNSNHTENCYEAKSSENHSETLPRRSSFLARIIETMTIGGEDNVAAGIEVTEEDRRLVLEELFENQKHLGVFLRNRSNHTANPSPHLLHSIAINESVQVVILAELPQWNILSSCFSNCAEILHNLVSFPLEGTRCTHTKNVLDSHFQRIANSLKKLKLNDDQKRTVKLLLTKWENLKKGGLNDYLQNGSKLILAPRLEISMTGLTEQLQEAFDSLIYSSLNQTLPYHLVAPSSAKNLKFVEEEVRKKLEDSMDYLRVKAADNISMTSYFQEFPGLLHYIYIDRNTGFMIAPSLTGEYKQLRPEYLATATKDKVWEMVEFSYSQLMKERFAVLFQDDCFYYSYFLWFEDFSGKPLKPKTFPSLKNYPMPGIIAGDFYRKLSSECFPDHKNTGSDKIQVFELFCIHVGVTTPPTILDQSRRLAAAIWEISGAAHTPLDLL